MLKVGRCYATFEITIISAVSLRGSRRMPKQSLDMREIASSRQGVLRNDRKKKRLPRRLVPPRNDCVGLLCRDKSRRAMTPHARGKHV